MKSSEVTLGVSSKGNTEALMLCLASVLNSKTLPAAIQIRLEGEFPDFSRFNFEQLAALAKLRGVLLSVSVFKSTGVRASRDWQLDTCPTQWLWLVDDDVVLNCVCLQAYMRAEACQGLFDLAELGFLAGSKCDVNNRRGYAGFSTAVQRRSALTPVSNHSLVYDVDDLWDCAEVTRVLDTGNCLLHIPVIRNAGCRFTQPGCEFNSSGDATMFSLVLAKAGLKGLFCPSAQAFHLEKAGGGFSEFNARGEMLMRFCESIGFPDGKQIVRDYYMPDLARTAVK